MLIFRSPASFSADAVYSHEIIPSPIAIKDQLLLLLLLRYSVNNARF